jgi:hypothetical protein
MEQSLNGRYFLNSAPVVTIIGTKGKSGTLPSICTAFLLLSNVSQKRNF